MSTRTTKLTIIGTAIGLVLAGAAIAPASAAPTAVSAATSCSALKGATATGPSVSFSGLALRENDTVTARVSSWSAGDRITATGTYNGLQWIFADGPASGFTFAAPEDGYYNLQFSLLSNSPTGATLYWNFDASCSTTTISPSPSPSPTATTKPGKGGKGGGKRP